MTKFHINSKGVPAPCKAAKGNCPFGGSSGIDNHYDTIEEAQEVADKINEEKHGILPKVDKPKLPSKEKMTKMYLKEINLKLKSGEEINGILSEPNIKNDKITVRLNGQSKKEVQIDMADLENIEQVSEYSYFSSNYQEDLRDNKKARPEFRFSKAELNDYEDTFVTLKYDNKELNGEVISTFYDGDVHNSGLIILSEDGSTKHIKTYRLESLEKTGLTQQEHNQYKKLRDFEDEIAENLFEHFNYDSEPKSSESADFKDPAEVIDEYFQAHIDKEKGLEVDLTKAGIYDFQADVDKHSGAYDDSSRFYYDRERGGGQYAEWTENSEELYQEDLDAAEDNETFVEDRKELVDNIVKEVKKTDWTPYYDTQEEGIVAALTHLKDSGIATDY